MKKLLSLATLLLIVATFHSGAAAQEQPQSASDSTPTVYFTKEITPESLVKIYKALGREATGKVAVKISTGESEKTGYLRPDFIRPLIDEVKGTIVECNVAYPGNRRYTADHLKAIEERGFPAIAPVDILDAEGDTILPLTGGKHLKYDIVGKHYLDYDFTIVLSHFKGHEMGGFGGALKNISIGLGSADGKAYIHSAGVCQNADSVWHHIAAQQDFIESMAEASKAITDHAGDNILYINVANRLSIDCDCNGNPAAPELGDLGIYASLDPIALDQACVDAVYNSPEPGKAKLIERIESRLGKHILDYGEQLGIGSRTYNLVEL